MAILNRPLRFRAKICYQASCLKKSGPKIISWTFSGRLERILGSWRLCNLPRTGWRRWQFRTLFSLVKAQGVGSNSRSAVRRSLDKQCVRAPIDQNSGQTTFITGRALISLRSSGCGSTTRAPRRAPFRWSSAMSTVTQSLELGNHDFTVTRAIGKVRSTELPDKEITPTTLPSISNAQPPEFTEIVSRFVGGADGVTLERLDRSGNTSRGGDWIGVCYSLASFGEGSDHDTEQPRPSESYKRLISRTHLRKVCIRLRLSFRILDEDTRCSFRKTTKNTAHNAAPP